MIDFITSKISKILVGFGMFLIIVSEVQARCEIQLRNTDENI
jgi:hypothetical protein